MELLIFAVEKALVGDKGLNIYPGIQIKDIDKRPELKPLIQGIELELRLPDGHKRRTHLVTYGVSFPRDDEGIFYRQGDMKDQFIIFTLPAELTPNDVPTGTEVWLITENKTS
jgi:hypothetical protein